jgi:hypothetical protein
MLPLGIVVVLVMLFLSGCRSLATTAVSKAPAATSELEQVATPTPESPTVTPMPVPPAIDADQNGILFSIGREDGLRIEYQQSGWQGIHEYECTIGVDCEKMRSFPSHLYAVSAADKWDDSAVERVKITFNLNKEFEYVTLRLVRAGAETSVVSLDDRYEFEVSSDMLGTYEHSAFGSYELELGSLDEGIHHIELSVADDGKGNGRFGWDAIVLITDEKDP